MTAPQPNTGRWPGAAGAADWPGRPLVEVPGLEEPAKFCHAAFTLDGIGHRAILVLASEDGALPTLDQISALADALDELHGEGAPVGSRAWPRDQVGKHREELARVARHETMWQRRAKQAEATLRERADVNDQAQRIEALTFDVARWRDAHAERQARVEALITERDQVAREVAALAAARSADRRTITRLRREVGLMEEDRDETRAALTQARATIGIRPAAAESPEEVEGLRAVLEQVRHERGTARREVEEQTGRAEAAEAAAHRLRQELGVTRQESAEARQESAEARADADRYANALTTLEQERDEARAMVLQLGPPAAELREEVEALRAERGELHDALLDTLRQLARRATAQLDAERQAATQTRRARSAIAGATAALFTAAATAAVTVHTAWRRTR